MDLLQGGTIAPEMGRLLAVIAMVCCCAVARAEPVGRGVWQFYTQPTALYHGGRSYVGWTAISDDRDVLIQYRIQDDGQFGPVVTLQKFTGNQDDHQNPAFLVTPGAPDGKDLVALWAPRWPQTQGVRFVRRTLTDETAPGTISTIGGMPTYADYPQPVYLGSGHVAVLFRGGTDRGNVMVVESTDYGVTWGAPWALVSVGAGEWAYPLTHHDGTNIDLAVNVMTGPNVWQRVAFATSTDLYAWKKADGTQITADARVTPLTETTADQVFTGNARIYDIARGSSGPIITSYTGFDQANGELSLRRHRYAGAWSNSVVTTVGNGLHRVPNSLAPADAHSAGIIIDRAAPDTALIIAKDRSGIFEIERWTTSDHSAWAVSSKITEGSQEHNFRPRQIAGHPTNKLLWLAGYFFAHNATALPQGRTDRPWDTQIVDAQPAARETDAVPLRLDAGRNLIPTQTIAHPADVTLTGTNYGGSAFSTQLRLGAAGLPIWSATGAATGQLYMRAFGKAALAGGATKATLGVRVGPCVLVEGEIQTSGGHAITDWRPVPAYDAQIILIGKMDAGTATFAKGELGVQFALGPHTVPHSCVRME